MEVVNKKLVLVVIIIGIFCAFFIWQNISDKETKLEMVSLNNETRSSSMFAIMLEEIDEEGNSSYVESSDNMWPSLKYRYNTTNSGCLDVNGTSIPDILSYDSKNQKAIVRTKKVAYCYLYFDIDESVYAKVRNDYTDNNGALLLSETESDEYPVYYYNGNITNNNILYANFCWKMVRTTETGGVKLIYNGVPDEAEDGTLTCDNTGEESQIGKSKFNSVSSLAHIGYMYNEVYSQQSHSKYSTGIMSWQYYPGEYYYGDTATWNGTEYVLSNSDGSEVTTYKMVDSYDDLVGDYTCLSTNATNCSSVSHVTGYSINEDRMFYYRISAGKKYSDYKVKLASSVSNNGNGTYSLIEPIYVTYIDWYKNYSNYKNYYFCSDLTSETCDYMVAVIPSSTSLTGWNIIPYKYGTSVKYEDGVYKLVDSIDFWNWPDNYSQIDNHHYTCLNVNDECESVNYVYYFNGSSTFYYITLSDGEFVEDAINKMLYAEDVNKTNSVIKDAIDTWYEDNIINKLDSNEILYSLYLEDTIWCSNREITSLGGWNPNNGNIKTGLGFDFGAFECNNKTDQFTLKVEVGGTEGYGNNALDYPIALMNAGDITMASTDGYINSGVGSFSISPSSFSNSVSIMQFWYDQFQGYYGANSLGIRPAVSLSNKVEILSGNGEVDNPYQIILATN